jgi:hypothetical protein
MISTVQAGVAVSMPIVEAVAPQYCIDRRPIYNASSTRCSSKTWGIWTRTEAPAAQPPLRLLHNQVPSARRGGRVALWLAGPAEHTEHD